MEGAGGCKGTSTHKEQRASKEGKHGTWLEHITFKSHCWLWLEWKGASSHYIREGNGREWTDWPLWIVGFSFVFDFFFFNVSPFLFIICTIPLLVCIPFLSGFPVPTKIRQLE